MEVEHSGFSFSQPKQKLSVSEKKLYMLESAASFWRDTAKKEPAYVFKNFDAFKNLTDPYGENYAREVLVTAAQQKPDLAFLFLNIYKTWKDPHGHEIVQDVLSAAVQKKPELAFQYLSDYEQLTQDGKKIAKVILQRASFSYENKRSYPDFFQKEEGRANQSNVILVFLESASAVDSQKIGGLQDRFPKIDAISDQGISFSNLYANGSASDMGHIATLLGIDPLLYGADGASYTSYTPYTSPLPQFFNDLGYHTLFVSTASLDFLNQRTLIKEIGYQTIADETAFK